MIQTYNNFLNEDSRYKPFNLLYSKHLFDGITNIMKNINLAKNKPPPNQELYNGYLDFVLKHKGWISQKDEESTMIYIFLEAWLKLSEIKMTRKQAEQILSNVREEATFNFQGGQREKIKRDADIEYTFGICKKGYEFLFALLKYCDEMARSYPFKFRNNIEKFYGKEILDNLILQDNIEYHLGIVKLSNAIMNLT